MAGPGKRVADVAASVVLSVVTFPLLVALAIGSAVCYRAWPFFVQERLGKGGEVFRMVKIRSLPVRTPAYVDKYSLASVANSRWGQLIRRTHFDELPQLWLVVTGKMSLVGPRPEMETVAGLFPEDFVRARCEVRPGCTGLWQVGPHASGLIGENPAYDLYYVTAGSLATDVRVLIRTVTQVLGASPLHLDELHPAAYNDEHPAPATAHVSSPS